MTSTETVNCSYCGESIARNAKACPHCGSDDQTGWSENGYLDGIDLGDDVDYEALRRNEFSPHSRKPFPAWQMITGAVLLLLFVAAIVRSVIY